jgi:hypothetical protein
VIAHWYTVAKAVCDPACNNIEGVAQVPPVTGIVGVVVVNK